MFGRFRIFQSINTWRNLGQKAIYPLTAAVFTTTAFYQMRNNPVHATTEDEYEQFRLAKLKHDQENCGVCSPDMSHFKNIYNNLGGGGVFKENTQEKEVKKDNITEKNDQVASTNTKPPIPGIKGSIHYIDVEEGTFPDPPTRIRVQLNEDKTIAPLECPADYYLISRSTWTYLHTMAAYFPENPTPDLIARMTPFFESFAMTYPCPPCSEHMLEYMKKNPVNASDNKALSMWICGLHNDVNRMQGKTLVTCNPEYLIRRYKTGFDDDSCQ